MTGCQVLLMASAATPSAAIRPSATSPCWQAPVPEARTRPTAMCERHLERFTHEYRNEAHWRVERYPATVPESPAGGTGQDGAADDPTPHDRPEC